MEREEQQRAIKVRDRKHLDTKSFGILNYGMDEETEKKTFLNAETKAGMVLLDNRL